jgi:hypothetical protein
VVRIKAFPMTKGSENENKFPRRLPLGERKQAMTGRHQTRAFASEDECPRPAKKDGDGKRRGRQNSASYRTPNHPDA